MCNTTFDRNPIAYVLGLSTYFQTKYHAHDNNSKYYKILGLYKCLDDTSVILKEEESTLAEIEMLHINAFHYTILEIIQWLQNCMNIYYGISMQPI